MTAAHESHPEVPPSAAGHLQPYGARVTLRPGAAGFAPEPFLVALLEGLAADCVASGAAVIGHLKCLLHSPAGTLPCNLTSLRAGATCSARDASTLEVLPAGHDARLDLAVLVYGLAAERIDALTRARLGRLLNPAHVSWSLEREGHGSHPAC